MKRFMILAAAAILSTGAIAQTVEIDRNSVPRSSSTLPPRRLRQ